MPPIWLATLWSEHHHILGTLIKCALIGGGIVFIYLSVLSSVTNLPRTNTHA